MKALKGYKTIIFNVLMSLTMVIRLWKPEVELPEATAVSGALDSLDAALSAIWGVGNIWLRAVTDTKILSKN